MKLPTTSPSKNYMRRTLGVILCFSPLALLASSLIAAFMGTENLSLLAFGFTIAALFLAILNFYLSFIRPRILLRRHGSLDGIRHVSGLPIIGSALVLLGGILGFGSLGTTLLGIVAVALDTGGSPWFLIMTWRDSSLWDTTR